MATPFYPGYASHPNATAAANARALLDGFKEVFQEEMKRAKPMYPEIYDVGSSTHKSEVYVSYVGTGLADEVSDGEPTPFEDMTDGEVKEIFISEYKKGYRISQATLEDDLKGVSKKPIKALPKAMEYKAEAVAAALVSGSFTTTYGWDPASTTKALIATDHNYTTGKFDLTGFSALTTWQNRLTSDSAPSPETITTMFQLKNNTRDREGFPLEAYEGLYFLTHPNLEPTFWAIMNSVNKAFEFSNTKSIMGPSGPWNTPVKTWQWLTSGTAWFLISKPNTPYKFLWRIKPSVKSDYDNNNGFQRYYSRMRFGVGAIEPRGIWGTPGV